MWISMISTLCALDILITWEFPVSLLWGTDRQVFFLWYPVNLLRGFLLGVS
jgi:hypothetical protein